MKKNYHSSINIISGIILLILNGLLPAKPIYATGHYPATANRGERPPIDLASVPDNAFEPGIIRIKFNVSVENHLDNAVISSNPEGTLLFGIAAVDLLNRQFGVVQIKKTFAAALQNTKFTERHRLWGFHLWYDLIVPAGTDIRSMVLAYAAKNEIQLSEPVYRKQLIGADINPVQSAAPTGGNAGLNYVPIDPRYNEQWHYNNTGQQSGTPDADIDLPEAWNITKGSSNVIVAVIDQGIEYMHTDLAANMWPGIGYNFVNNNTIIIPGNHGTHVSGTIAANTNNGIGVCGIAGGSGTGNGVRLMSCQVFIEDGGSGGFENAPVWAADNGAAISQNSWGYKYSGSYDQAVLDAIDYFNANGGGTVLNGGISIFAAGNSGSSGQWYPGCYSGCFSVAATGNQDLKAWYSNYDTWVDISAPGGETNAVTQRGVLSCLIGNSYGFLQGTSMACPHASGVAALIISLAPGVLTPQDVKSILTSTTDYIDGLNPSYAGMLGAGRLNAYQALLTTQLYLNPLLPSPPQSITASAISHSQINLNWTLNAASDVVMLAYNTINSFGIPTGNYTPLQTITGGGTVLYEGTLSSFQQLSLNPLTTYYYRLWSKNGDGYSAVSLQASATTLCGEFTIPFNESFTGTNIPSCWTQADNQGNGQIWQFGIMTGQSPALTGNYAYLNSDGYGIGNSQNADLITPTLNLSAYSSVTLQFNHFFKSYSGSSGKLSYSLDDASTWILLQTFTTTSPTNPANYNQTIAAVAGQSQVKFKWNYTGAWAYYWAIDDIQITGTLISPSLSVTPANQNVTYTAGTTAFTVTSNSSWTVTSNQPWCSANPSGTGDGTIYATYTGNNTASQRVANISVTVTGLSPVVVTVTQAAPTIAVTPPNQVVTSAPGTAIFNVTSNINWSASSDQTWCTVTNAGFGNGIINAVFTENSLNNPKVANITVTATGLPPLVVTLIQEGAPEKVLNLFLLLEGFYSGNGNMNPAMNTSGVQWGPGVADLITIELHEVNNYPNIIYSIPNVALLTNGNASATFPSIYNGNYFITVRHRNSIETVSMNPVDFSSATTAYSFDLPSKVFGNNLKLLSDGNWAVFGGDVNQDGTIDLGDMTPIDNAVINFATGYVVSDANGDGSVDIGDFSIIDNNQLNFVTSKRPQ